MPTSFVQGPFQHTNDLEFRAWSKQVSDQLQAVGLVKTADTGQANFETMTRPAASTFAGYEMYRFDDALQATHPIYVKVEYGTGANAATYPAIRVSTGSATNGSGALAVTHFTRTLTHGATNTTPGTGSAYRSYACKSNAMGGFFFLGWQGAYTAGSASYSTTMHAFGVVRPCDEAGNLTNEGYTLYAHQSATLWQYVWSFTANSAMTVQNSAYALVPLPSSATTAVAGTDVQVFRHQQAFPRVRHNNGLLTYYVGDITTGTTFTIQNVGTTARTYMAAGDAFRTCAVPAVTEHTVAFMWE